MKGLLKIWSQYPGSVVPLAMFYWLDHFFIKMQFCCNLRCCSADKSYLIVDICNLFQTGTLKQEQSEGGWRSGRGLIASPSLLFKILSWWSCQCHSLSNSKGVRIQIKKYISCALLKVHHRPLARFFLRASCSGMRVNPELCGSSYQIQRPPTLHPAWRVWGRNCC